MQKTFVIITAMWEEAEIIISKLGLKSSKKLHNIQVFESTNSEKHIVLIFSGIGKIQAAIATTYAFENYTIDKLINIGIAGNLRGNEANIGDVFLPDCFWQSDMYLPFEGEHLDYAKKPILIEQNFHKKDFKNFHLIGKGTCATADRFVDNPDEIAELRKNFEADICEMEAFAILSVARTYDALDKCIVIKSISDGADDSAQTAHMNYLELAMQNGVEVLMEVLS